MQENRLWYRDAVLYAMDVETFADGNGDGIGDFVGATERLDHLVDLGVTCLWILPFYPTPNRDNGYDIANYYGIDPRLGTLEEFIAFVHAAKSRGLRLITDLVVNHTSSDHPWFQAARHDRRSRFRSYYVWADDPPPTAPGQGTIFPGQEASVWTWDDVAGQYYYHRFYDFEPGIDAGHPEVRAEIERIVDFWISFGIDGLRVDAAAHMIEGRGSDGGAPDHDLLKQLRSFAEQRQPNVVLLGEVDEEPEETKEFFGSGDELNMLFNFYLDNYLFLALARCDGRPVAEALAQLPPAPGSGQWANFLRNLDELDLERLTDAERAEVFEAFAPEPEMRIFERGIRRRLAPMLGDEGRLRMAHCLLFAMPGTPTIVYGDEIGMGEDLELQGRTAVRVPMQWCGEPRCGFSTAAESRLVRRPVDDGPYSYERVNVADQKDDPDSLLRWMQALIRVRRQASEVGCGHSEVLDTGANELFGIRHESEAGTSIVLINLGTGTHRVASATVSEWGEGFEELLSSDGSPDERTGGTITLGRYGCRWLRRPADGEEG